MNAINEEKLKRYVLNKLPLDTQYEVQVQNWETLAYPEFKQLYTKIEDVLGKRRRQGEQYGSIEDIPTIRAGEGDGSRWVGIKEAPTTRHSIQFGNTKHAMFQLRGDGAGHWA